MFEVIEARIDMDSEDGPVLEILLFDEDGEGELTEIGSTFISLLQLKEALDSLSPVETPPIKKRAKLRLKEPV